MSTHARSSAPSLSAVVELLKPVTWFPPMWAFACGVVSAGVSTSGRWPTIALGIVLTGPLVCACSQAVNDWYDRDVDAINEPNRPIPSGRIPGTWGFTIAVIWTVLSLLASAVLGQIVFYATVLGLALAWAYSAPPLRLKRDGWWGNAACALSYEGLAWVTGAAVMTGGVPSGEVFVLAALYSFGAHGIMTLNDFKSVEGDTAMGIASLPVQLGVPAAARVACVFMALAQVGVAVALALWGRPLSALAVAAMTAVQLVLMRRLLEDPAGRAPWYNGTGIGLFVSGMMVSASAIRSLG